MWVSRRACRWTAQASRCTPGRCGCPDGTAMQRFRIRLAALRSTSRSAPADPRAEQRSTPPPASCCASSRTLDRVFAFRVPPDAREADTDLGVLAESQKAALDRPFAAAPTPGWWFRPLIVCCLGDRCHTRFSRRKTAAASRVRRMEILCADCGCLVNAGVVLAPCPDQECCCAALPREVPAQRPGGSR